MEVSAVLLVPHPGDELGLLAEGPCGARPPVARKKPGHSDWLPGHAVKPGWSPGPRGTLTALVLAWDGKPVAEGLDRAGHWFPGISLGNVVADGQLCARQGLGTLILLDADGREITP